MSKPVLSERIFYNLSGRQFSLREVVEEIRGYVAKHPESFYEVVIGSDSQSTLGTEAYFVTAIVIRRIGNGGVHFWMRQQEQFATLRDRIWKEAMRSIMLAQELRSLMKDMLGEEIFWEDKVEFRCIHLDVGENGPTRDFIDGISGMVKGFGFVPIIKPYAYGASVVADKHT